MKKNSVKLGTRSSSRRSCRNSQRRSTGFKRLVDTIRDVRRCYVLSAATSGNRAIRRGTDCACHAVRARRSTRSSVRRCLTAHVASASRRSSRVAHRRSWNGFLAGWVLPGLLVSRATPTGINYARLVRQVGRSCSFHASAPCRLRRRPRSGLSATRRRVTIASTNSTRMTCLLVLVGSVARFS